MMYCAPEDIRQLIKDDLASALLGDVYIDDPADREAKLQPLVEQAIVDAGAEIDGYLAKRYPVPLANPPPAVSKYAKDLAAYNLISRIGVGGSDSRESNYRERYRAALHWLELVTKGEVDLSAAPPTAQSSGGVRIGGPERLFSRDSLHGM